MATTSQPECHPLRLYAATLIAGIVSVLLVWGQFAGFSGNYVAAGSPWSALSLIGVPSSLQIGRYLVSDTKDSLFSAILAPVATAALWLSLIHIAALLSGSFAAAVMIAAGILCLIGIWTARFTPPLPQLTKSQFAAVSAIALTAAAVIGPTIWLHDYHDKLNMGPQGHFSYISALANDKAYPPRDIVFPTELRNYHFGVHLPIAILISWTGWRVDVATDIVELITWSWCSLLFGLTAYWLFKRTLWALALGSIVGPLAGGWSMFSSIDPARGVPVIGGQMLQVPFASFFFQMPFSLGTCLFLTSIIILAESASSRAGWRRLAALAVLLIAQANTNSILFVVFAAGTSICLLCSLIYRPSSAMPPTRADVTGILATIAATCMLFFALNGLWRSLAGGAQSPSVIRLTLSGFTGDWPTSILYFAEVYGALILPILFLVLSGSLVGFTKESRVMRRFFLWTITGCLVIYNTFTHTQTWDIIKFSSAAQILASVVACGMIITLVRRPTFFRLVAGTCLLLATIWTPARSIFATNKALYGQTSTHGSGLRFDQAVIQGESWLPRLTSDLRSRASAKDVVYAEPETERLLALLGGVPVSRPTGWEPVFGINRKLLDDRIELLESPGLTPRQLSSGGVQWMVRSPRGTGIDQLLDTWVEKGSAVVVSTHGNAMILAPSTTEPSTSN